MPTAAKPAATAASLATRFRVEVLGRTDFFDFAGRLAFVVLLVFDLAPARFKLVFDLTRLALKGKSFFNDFDDGAGPWSARDRVRSHGRRAGGNNFIRTRVGHLARVVLHHEGFVKKGIQS